MAETMAVNRRGRSTVEKVQVEKRDQYLAFVVGGESFAMDIRSVKEVIQYGSLTAVPLMPDFIRGVINLRGAVVPVIDLSVRFGRPANEVGRRTCIVILEVEHQETEVVIGVVVDNVSEVLEIGASEIEPAPTFGSTLRSEFLAGVGKVGNRFVIILDVNHVLSIEEMATLASRVDTDAAS
jgi:purine-binding chemotaxis protein CheW